MMFGVGFGGVSMVELTGLLRLTGTGILNHLDMAGVNNLLATSRSVQAAVAPVLGDAMHSICGINRGHALVKHCLPRLANTAPNWAKLVSAFQDSRGKSKANNQTLIPLKIQIKANSVPPLAPADVATLRRRVIGIDPATGGLLDDPGKSESSAFTTEIAFDACLWWASRAYHSLMASNFSKRSGRYRYQGHTIDVTYMPKLGGHKLVIPAAAVLTQPAVQAVSYMTTLKFAEIAATIGDLGAALLDKKNPDANTARSIVDGVAASVTQLQPIASVVAIFKSEKGSPVFLFSMYPE